jgi:hypothetical protein
LFVYTPQRKTLTAFVAFSWNLDAFSACGAAYCGGDADVLQSLARWTLTARAAEAAAARVQHRARWTPVGAEEVEAGAAHLPLLQVLPQAVVQHNLHHLRRHSLLALRLALRLLPTRLTFYLYVYSQLPLWQVLALLPRNRHRNPRRFRDEVLLKRGEVLHPPLQFPCGRQPYLQLLSEKYLPLCAGFF